MLSVHNETLARRLEEVKSLERRTCLEARIFTDQKDTSPAIARGSTEAGFLDMLGTAVCHLTAEIYGIDENGKLLPGESQASIKRVEFFADRIFTLPLLGDLSVSSTKLGESLSDALRHLKQTV